MDERREGSAGLSHCTSSGRYEADGVQLQARQRPFRRDVVQPLRRANQDGRWRRSGPAHDQRRLGRGMGRQEEADPLSRMASRGRSSDTVVELKAVQNQLIMTILSPLEVNCSTKGII